MIRKRLDFSATEYRLSIIFPESFIYKNFPFKVFLYIFLTNRKSSFNVVSFHSFTNFTEQPLCTNHWAKYWVYNCELPLHSWSLQSSGKIYNKEIKIDFHFILSSPSSCVGLDFIFLKCFSLYVFPLLNRTQIFIWIIRRNPVLISRVYTSTFGF